MRIIRAGVKSKKSLTQGKVEVRSLQSVLNREHNQLQLFSRLKREFVSAMNVQVMARRA